MLGWLRRLARPVEGPRLDPSEMPPAGGEGALGAEPVWAFQADGEARALTAGRRIARRWTPPGPHASLPAGQRRRGPGPLDAWSRRATELYRGLVRVRVGECSCDGCGLPFDPDSLVGVAGGTTLDDQRLSDEGAARLLASTQRLSVRCGACGMGAQIEAELPAGSETVTARDQLERAWDPRTIGRYESLLRERVSAQACGACGGSLEGAALLRSGSGGVAYEPDFSDETNLLLLAVKQGLSARCPHCGLVVAIAKDVISRRAPLAAESQSG